jgi:serine/threonine protein kinase
MHLHNFIHRDIKPENFVIGQSRSKQGLIYVIDLGLAKKYRDSKSGMHIAQSSKLSLTGTARYASINAHLGFCNSTIINGVIE